MRMGTLSWRMRTPTCRFRMAESLSRRQCITLCDSTAETECMRDTYRVILLRTAAFACQSNTRLRFLMPCRSGRPSPCSVGRRSIATIQANRNGVFRRVHVLAHSWVRASRHRLQCGGGESWRRQSCLRGEKAWQTRLSASQPLSGWCWRWRSSARSTTGQDQPGY